MELSKAIYSERTECQDCYKCIRECPVKAIRVTDGSAIIMPEVCIVCGHCVSVCPSGAKKVRNDLDCVKQLLLTKNRVVVSLAPSFISEFRGIDEREIIHAIKALGFYAVSETALGAQEVSADLAKKLTKHISQPRVFLSTACPVAVEYITKYRPELTESVTGVLSPLLAHCKLLKKHYGEDTGIVFIGPCIAKKLEAHSHPELLDAAITFEDIRSWMDTEGLIPGRLSVTEKDIFEPVQAEEGSLYPIEGGMLQSIKMNCQSTDIMYMSLSGINNIEAALRDLHNRDLSSSVFLELLACEGGCINGPKASTRSAITSRLDVLDYANQRHSNTPRKPQYPIEEVFPSQPVSMKSYPDADVSETLNRIGKYDKEDELNCGGCGYHSCRELASAVLGGKAETNMCVSYMRKLAQKKANAILHTLPYATVLIDEKLNVIECNNEFVRLCGEDALVVNEVIPGLEGACLDSLLPFSDLFKKALDTGEDILRKYIRFGDTVLSTTIFSVEPHRVVGAIMIDVSDSELRRAQIVDKAQTVIHNMLSTVQDIAFRLGKNSAESELILKSIVDGFSVTSYDKEKDEAQ